MWYLLLSIVDSNTVCVITEITYRVLTDSFLK
jgi:hypothetical protein